MLVMMLGPLVEKCWGVVPSAAQVSDILAACLTVIAVYVDVDTVAAAAVIVLAAVAEAVVAEVEREYVAEANGRFLVGAGEQ